MTTATFPLLADPDGYVACEWDLTADAGRRAYWLDLFRTHFDSVLGHARQQSRALGDPPAGDLERRCAVAEGRFTAYLDVVEERPGQFGRLDVRAICLARQDALIAAELPDPYMLAKQQENDLALRLLPGVLADLDAMPAEARAQAAVRGVFAGNIYDLGAVATLKMFERGPVDFRDVRRKLKPRPWFFDDLDAWLARLARGSAYRGAVLFVDNAGPDIVLGMIPLARELLSRGTHVILTANSEPALNDVTHAELVELLDRAAATDQPLQAAMTQGQLQLVPSGNTTPLLDLTQISPELADAVQRHACDLVVLEGMGRAIETNFSARFRVDCLKLAMLKDEEVARCVGAGLYDLVMRYEPAHES